MNQAVHRHDMREAEAGGNDKSTIAIPTIHSDSRDRADYANGVYLRLRATETSMTSRQRSFPIFMGLIATCVE